MRDDQRDPDILDKLLHFRRKSTPRQNPSPEGQRPRASRLVRMVAMLSLTAAFTTALCLISDCWTMWIPVYLLLGAAVACIESAT